MLRRTRQGLVIQSLAAALAVAFVVMLLSINVWVALMIGAIVVMVDADPLAAIYFFNNNLAPFTFAAVSSAPPPSAAPLCPARPAADPTPLLRPWHQVVISVGLCLDYSIHVAQEFLLCPKKTGDDRAMEAVRNSD